MAEFLTTRGTAAQIEKTIKDAQQTLTLVTPYLKLPSAMLQRLKDAAARGVKIRLVYGKEDLNPSELEKLASLPGLELSYLERLHAKCYLNEKQAVLTSMNLHEYSEHHNVEMGVLMDSSRDAELYNEITAEVMSILREARAEKSAGSCIRCAAPIPYDPNRPHCSTCFGIWAGFGNDLYQEQRCHFCGELRATSRARPLCHDCFAAHPFTAAVSSF